MKDRLFSGSDVQEALAVASASLGLPRAELRYVVLDPGAAGGRGLKPTPARIAVLLQEARPGADSRGESPQPPFPPERTSTDVPAGVGAVLAALAETGGLALEWQLEESEEALLVHLRGDGSAFFHGEDGRGEPLRALEHLLQRSYGELLRPRVLRLRCAGFRERRDRALTEEARRLAAEVRADGQPRTLAPMNAYERRVVHLALQDESALTTHSVGEGPDRRVRVAPRAEEPSPPTGSGAGGGDGDGL